jgi:hypothetical protein
MSNKRKRNDCQGVLKEVNYEFEIPADLTRLKPFGEKREQGRRSEAYEEF